MSIVGDVTRGPGLVKLAPLGGPPYLGAEGPMTSLRLLVALFHLAWSQQPDSLATLRVARRAQAAFESIRRGQLPYGYGHSGGPCDLRIGRFCYWYDDERRERPAPEPLAIRDARATLLAALDDARARLPGDPWIAGQRVRYLVEDGRDRAAVSAARECRADGWWCAALLGLALHTAGAFAGADSAFDAALRDMPDPERCRWYQLAPLLPDELRHRYERMSCEDRAAFESRWWWLAAPLLSRPGNDRRTEHLARLTLARIAQTSRTAYGLSWGDDLRELLLRFGWPTYWTREESPSVTAPEPLILGHDPTPAFHFFPSTRAFDVPTDATSDDWTLEASHAPERYAPTYADTFQRLEDQTAIFRRGDSCLVVAAYDLSSDAVLAHQAAQAALVVARDEHSNRVTQHSARSDGPDVLTLSAPCDAQLLSLEIVAPRARRVARARHGIPPRGTPGAGLSGLDVLLFDPPDSLPGELSAVLPHVLGTTRVRADRKLGLFWELYGLTSAAQPVSASLAITPRGVGWLRRTAESLGFASRTTTVSLHWEEVPATRAEDAAVVSRALTVDLSALSPGRYRIALTVTAPGQEPATATREIEVVRP
jgi:hypothetical protein